MTEDAQENRTSMKVLVYAFSNPDVRVSKDFSSELSLTFNMEMRKENAAVYEKDKEFIQWKNRNCRNSTV